MENLCGILNIYKEKGYTSHDVVNILRKILKEKKVGHTGTLDPDAKGILPICVGKATKIASYITEGSKTYKAIVCLGKTTTTQDATGDLLKECKVNVSEQEIRNTVNSFIGEIYQLPPMYSAIKVKGEKLYKLAREGKEIKRNKRLVNIFNIKIEKFINNEIFEISVDCSKGTYIRTLCNDIGDKLGCGGHMASLIRTKTGVFSLDNSITIDKLTEIAQSGKLKDYIFKVEDVLNGFNKITVSSIANKYLYNGNIISFNYIKGYKDLNLCLEEKVFAYDELNNLIGIYQVKCNHIKPLTILF